MAASLKLRWGLVSSAMGNSYDNSTKKEKEKKKAFENEYTSCFVQTLKYV